MFKAFHADAALAPQPMSRPAPQAANAAQVSQQPQSRPVAAISEAEKPAASEMSAVQMLRRKAVAQRRRLLQAGHQRDQAPVVEGFGKIRFQAHGLAVFCCGIDQ